MNPTDFNALLKQLVMTTSERNQAWEDYKTKGPDVALAFVQKIQGKIAHMHENLELKNSPVTYKVWGEKYIETDAIKQMVNAARLPVAVAGALMPDAHVGYGLPIGGVLATENAVIPYAVGVDIACRMMLSIYPTSSDVLKNPKTIDYKNLHTALVQKTIFGAGGAGIHDGKIDHPILDKSHWQFSNLTKNLRQTAIYQIGTSGSGNHFVEWGELTITDTLNPFRLPVGNYLALLSHSGSRGVGFKIANHYTDIAMSQMAKLDPSVKHLAWLPLDQDIGREYFQAMHLAGEFASANHQVIHQRLSQAIGIEPIASVENHHNFAWQEKMIINGKEKDVIVHRKGATPAGNGVLGIIPGTMADPGYLVAGKGNLDSLNSASHGSGRAMGRNQAKKSITEEDCQAYLAKKGIDLIGGGLDEAPQAYKPINAVMDEQKDLVSILGKFQPKIVRMANEKDFLRQRKTLPKGIVDGE